GASVSFGDGDNLVDVEGGRIGEDASLSFGDGDNYVLVGEGHYGDGDIDGAALSFGDGDNTVAIDGSISGESHLELGDGDNSIEVGNSISGSTLDLGDGANTVAVGSNVESSALSFGDGGNTLSVGSAIVDGSAITFGAGADTFTLGGGESQPLIAGEDQATVVDLGAGDDTVTIVGANLGYDLFNELNYPVVVSGGALHGGEGHDTLTVRAVDSLDLVQRTAAQQVVVSFNGSYKAGDIVSVSFGGGEPYEYVVQNGDVVLGDAEATRANVVNGLAHALGEAQ